MAKLELVFGVVFFGGMCVFFLLVKRICWCLGTSEKNISNTVHFYFSSSWKFLYWFVAAVS